MARAAPPSARSMSQVTPSPGGETPVRIRRSSGSFWRRVVTAAGGRSFDAVVTTAKIAPGPWRRCVEWCPGSDGRAVPLASRCAESPA